MTRSLRTLLGVVALVPHIPIDQFIFDAAVATPRSVGDIPILQHVFNTEGDLQEFTVNAVRHHDYDSPSR